MDELKIVLDGERPKSWNAWYAGSHWRIRKQEADRVHMLVIAALGGRPSRITKPVEVELIAYFKGRQLDCDNLPIKLYIDGMVRAGLLANDTPRYLVGTTTRSRIDKHRPRVELIIREAA